jgi:hypothetical protein
MTQENRLRLNLFRDFPYRPCQPVAGINGQCPRENEMQIAEKTTETYFDRNAPWLIPACCVFMIVTTPLLVTMLDVNVPLPGWSIQVMAGVGSLLVGFRTTQVDTLSARFIRIVCVAVVIALILVQVFP